MKLDQAFALLRDDLLNAAIEAEDRAIALALDDREEARRHLHRANAFDQARHMLARRWRDAAADQSKEA